MEGLEFARRYLKGQRLFLTKPRRFVAVTDFTAKTTTRNAYAFLVIGGTVSIIAGRININLYGERIRRVVQVYDTVEGLVFFFCAVGFFSILSFAIYRLLGGTASFRGTISLLMHVIGFTAPILTLLLILITRLESAALGIVLVLVPPTHIIPFDTLPTTAPSLFLQRAFNTALLAWNLYLGWLLWNSLRTLNQISGVRALLGLLGAVGSLYALSGPIGRVVSTVIEPLRPLWEEVFK